MFVEEEVVFQFLFFVTDCSVDRTFTNQACVSSLTMLCKMTAFRSSILDQLCLMSNIVKTAMVGKN